MFKKYYEMTKPGIIYGNAITAIAGFLLASKGNIKLSLLLETIIGTSLIIGSACVFNNYLDRNIDEVMSRTKKRALVIGSVAKKNAIIFGAILGIVGFIIIGAYTNNIVFYIGVIAFVDYVVLYGLSKRLSTHGTLVGSIAGAAPIVAGYCAVRGQIDSGAIILFIILALWQMPHFYAIAMYRFNDYKRAKIPVLPVKRGMTITKIQILIYVLAFICATTTLTIYGYTNNFYLVIVLVVGLGWLFIGLKGFRTKNNILWARKMFFYSLVTLLIFSFLISVNSWTS